MKDAAKLTVQYWCAILCAIGFVFLFLFMEETNYHRTSLAKGPKKVTSSVESSPSDVKAEAQSSDKQDDAVLAGDFATIDADNCDYKNHQKKSYISKLKVFESKSLTYPNRLRGMVLRPLIFLTFPVILYSGFSYGSNLVWFNVLNGTASLVLSSPPYKFSSSLVGLAYLSPFIGVTLG